MNKKQSRNDQNKNFRQISVKVLEAYTRDVGRGIIRIDHVTMDAIGAITGDIVEINGRTKTVGACLPLYPSDENKGMARVDGLMRNNAGVSIGDSVILQRVDSVAAQKISVVPVESVPPIDERYLADSLDGVPVMNGDHLMVPYFGGRLIFKAISIEPSPVVTVNKYTIFTIEEKVKSPNQTQAEDIIKKINAKIEEQEKILVKMLDDKDLDELKMSGVLKNISKLEEIKAHFAKKLK